MDNLKLGEIINVQAFKHDGQLYRQWNGVKVIEVSDDHAVLFMFKTKVLEATGQKWVVREPMLWFMQSNTFYNTTALLRKSGTHFYTNLASPAIADEGTIKYIDYDLDIKAYPRQKLKVVDQKEFGDNADKYEYSQKLIKKIKETTDHLKDLITNKDGYFDEKVVDDYVNKLIAGQQLSNKWKNKK